ncbi:MAG: ribonuclease Z [Cyclobacteriaceae bacterium]|nr:ribonuclease Z [Cyclobacteriaceae bacterium]
MSFTVTILGSNAALPALGRHPSAHFLEMLHEYILIDCGEGTQMQMTRYGCSALRIQRIFITHLHGDHYLGLMGLLFSMHLQRRRQELHLYAPHGLDEIITLQLRHSNSALSFPLHFHAVPTDTKALIYQSPRISVFTLPLQHKIPCAGYLFQENPKPVRINKDKLPDSFPIRHIAQLKQGLDITDESGSTLWKNTDLTLPPKPSRSYAYCSDTRFTPALADLIQGVDLLYHEATFAEADADKATETRHSTAKQAAQMAQLCGARQLLIGHFSARNKNPDELLEEARRVFPDTLLATEGESIVIPD